MQSAAGAAAVRGEAGTSATQAPDPEDDAGSDTLDAGTTTLDAAVPTQHDAALPPADLSVEQLLDWVLSLIASDTAPSPAEIMRNFSPDFLAQVPATELTATFARLHDQIGSFEITSRNASAIAINAALATSSGPWTVRIQISAGSPHQITVLWFQPATTSSAQVPTSYQQAFTILSGLAARSHLLVAEVNAETCVPLQARNADARLAIGSAFKLWVLSTLDGYLNQHPELGWESQLAIRDAAKSAPSGVLQNQPAGTELSLREFASEMISISDNTATDHLIDLVGRDAVEQSQLDSMHSDPAANTPWLYTRELFALKAWASPDQVQAYRNASTSERRALLPELRALPIDSSKLAGWSTPRLLEFEWFASAADLCRILAKLGTRAAYDRNSDLLRILSMNPGVAFDAADWPYIGYKGGSEPGVLNTSWLLQRRDGRWFSIVMTLNDDSRVIDQNRAIALALGLSRMLAMP